MAEKTTKEELAKLKNEHDLHVLLIMRFAETSKAEAIRIAYSEGRDGLAERLSETAGL